LAGADDTRRIILPAATPARRWPHLIILEGEGLGQVFRLLGPETIIGRAPGVDIFLDSDTVSRQHARLVITGDQVTVEDLGSRNGTYVDMDVVKEPRLLHDGAHLAIGTSTMLKLTHAIALDAAVRKAGFELASRDPATLAANTHYFIDRLRAEHAFAVRHRQPLTLVFLRVDGIEARAGDEGTEKNSEGERLMREVAAIFRSSLRAEDLLARSDADLFVALIRSSGRQGVEMAERMRACVRRPGETADGGTTPALTAVVVPLAASGFAAAETILVAATNAANTILRQSRDRVVALPPLVIDAAIVPSDGA